MSHDMIPGDHYFSGLNKACREALICLEMDPMCKNKPTVEYMADLTTSNQDIVLVCIANIIEI